VDGGLYPKAAQFIAVIDAHAATLRACFVNANALSDVWTVRAKVLIPKDGARTYQLSTTHEGSLDDGPTAKSLEACHTSTMNQWPWPSSAGIEGHKGGPGYIVVLAGTRR
jgi:hypothetical protein